MNISLSEASSYRLWKRLTRLFNPESAASSVQLQKQQQQESQELEPQQLQQQQQALISVPCQAVAIVTRKYLASNQHFVNSRGGFTWKVMVKINLCDLVVKLISSRLADRVDELGFQRLWQMIHLENMATYFDMLIELLDENACANTYLLSSERMYSALCDLANNTGCGRTTTQSQSDFLHFICYFYCGTSPGFLHRHEVVLLLQDLCRSWRVIHERIYNFCDTRNSNTGRLSIGLLKFALPTLIGDGSQLLAIAKAASSSSSSSAATSASASVVDSDATVGRAEFLAYMHSEFPAFLCNETRVNPVV